MRQRYTVVLEEEAEGVYHAFCPSLPGCHSEGDSIDAALANVREAIELYLESLAAHGEEIPSAAPPWSASSSRHASPPSA
jgi:predicted RNase H-like HicB family nuclease